MSLKQISIFKYFIPIMSHQTSESGAKWSQGLPEPYFFFLPLAAVAALSCFLVLLSVLVVPCAMDHPLAG